MKTAGCILAGGRSSRFGSDKALVMWKGETLLAHAIARLRPQVQELAINGNEATLEYTRHGIPIITDETASFDGPLAGVLAGIRWARICGADFVVTAAVDTPLFPADLVAVLANEARKTIIAAESATGLHPTFALWSVSIEPALASWLASGQSRSMTEFLKSQPFHTAFFKSDGPLDPFFNINTPQDLEALNQS